MIVASASAGDQAGVIAELLARAPFGGHSLMAALEQGGERHDRRAVGGGPAVEEDHGPELRQLVADGLNLLELLARGNDGRPRARVLQDVFRLRRRQRRIDRHRDAAGRQDPEVRHQPLGTALGDDGDAIALGHAERPQPQRRVPNLLEELLARQPLDALLAAPTDARRLRHASHHVERQVSNRVDVSFRRRGGQGSHGGIIEAPSFQLPASSFQLPASSFQLPASSFSASSSQLSALSFPLEPEAWSLEPGVGEPGA